MGFLLWLLPGRCYVSFREYKFTVKLDLFFWDPGTLKFALHMWKPFSNMLKTKNTQMLRCVQGKDMYKQSHICWGSSSKFYLTRWWNFMFLFTLIWPSFPIWLRFFRWVVQPPTSLLSGVYFFNLSIPGNSSIAIVPPEDTKNATTEAVEFLQPTLGLPLLRLDLMILRDGSVSNYMIWGL